MSSRFPSARGTFSNLPPLFRLLVIVTLLNAFMILGIAGHRSLVFRNTAIIKSINVGVYWDADCTKPIEELEGIDWGIVEPGRNATAAVYIRNEGNYECCLNVTAADWYPVEVEDYLTLRADYDGEPIGVGETLLVELVLNAKLNIAFSGITSFDFLIIIDASG